VGKTLMYAGIDNGIFPCFSSLLLLRYFLIFSSSLSLFGVPVRLGPFLASHSQYSTVKFVPVLCFRNVVSYRVMYSPL